MVNSTEYNFKCQIYLSAFVTFVHYLLQCNVAHDTAIWACGQMDIDRIPLRVHVFIVAISYRMLQNVVDIIKLK